MSGDGKEPDDVTIPVVFLFNKEAKEIVLAQIAVGQLDVTIGIYDFYWISFSIFVFSCESQVINFNCRRRLLAAWRDPAESSWRSVGIRATQGIIERLSDTTNHATGLYPMVLNICMHEIPCSVAHRKIQQVSINLRILIMRLSHFFSLDFNLLRIIKIKK